MNKNIWIITFFVVLAGYIAGMQLQKRHQSVLFKGGRSYKIDLRKEVNVEQVRKELTVMLGEETIIKAIGHNSILDITTPYLINQSSPGADSAVLTVLMKGLTKYLPTRITYEEFDTEHKLEQKKVLPALYDRNPSWVKQIVYPFLQYGCKALLMPLLVIFLLVSLKNFSTHLKKWIVAALFFSWAGDVLLMFEAKDKMFFMLGLSAFLIAHTFYIVFFHYVRVREKVKGNPWLMVIVVVYYAALIALLSPYLADLKWPVRVYGIVISFMFMLAMHMLFIKSKNAGKWMMIGALLFVISDSVLAINKFYQPFEGAGIMIIVTYALAQLFIVQGAIRYIQRTDKE